MSDNIAYIKTETFTAELKATGVPEAHLRNEGPQQYAAHIVTIMHHYFKYNLYQLWYA